ncbi:MAG: radical SAM protein [Sphaerochaetaceae bacterium]
MDFQVLILRLSPFRDIVKSTPHQFLYGECARLLPDSQIDFAFLPMERERKKEGLELVGIRSHRRAADFDLILISNSYAVELINLPYMLRLANIPYSTDERVLQHTKPLLVMGGSNALASQGILYASDNALVDALYLGEGENNTTALVKALMDIPLEGRRAKLIGLQGVIPGLKVFGAPWQKIIKAIYADTEVELLATSKQALFDSSEATTARLQIAYGCPGFCTFCFEGWERKPYREVPFEALLRAAHSLRKETGADTLEITAFNFNTHTEVVRLIKELNRLFFRVNFMSQRADILARNPSLVHYEVSSDKRQYTIGVEGISQKMRSYFHKDLDKATLLHVIKLLLAEQIREIKLFFILSGLETDNDILDFKGLLDSIEKMKIQSNRGVRILCSFGLLVRMPFTPLRYERLLLTEQEWEDVVSKVRQTVQSSGYEFRLTYPYEEYFLSQALVMTNQFIAPTLEKMARKGLVYDQSLPSGAWKFFCTEVKWNSSFIKEKTEDYPFAYDFVDCRIPSSFLYQRFLSAKAGLEAGSCLGDVCKGCSSCNREQRSFLANHTISMPTQRDCEEISLIMKEKAQARPLFIKVDIPKEYAGARRETKAAFIIKQLVNKIEAGTEAVMTVRDVLFDGDSFEGKMISWYGQSVYAVYPFSNGQRDSLACALSQNGYLVGQEPLSIKKIGIRIENALVQDGQQLEKIASQLLKDMYMPYILSRKGAVTNFTIVPKALKKHVVQSCKIMDKMILLECQSKFDLSSIRDKGYIAQLLIE